MTKETLKQTEEIHKLIRENKDGLLYEIYSIIWVLDMGYDHIYIWNLLKHMFDQQSDEWKKWEDNSEFPSICLDLLYIWKHHDLWIHKQSQECIEYVYNLITNH